VSGRGAVVLFDIDGTLIRRAGPHHRLALISAIRETTGLETSFSGIDTSGRLDRDLIRIMLETAGADAESIQQCMTETVKLAQRIYTSSTVDLRRKVCPGVRVALRRLQVARIPMGLVTGNLTAIGWRKMEAAGLTRYFRFGAFAEQAHTRAELVAIALRHARRGGWLGRDTRVSLVGDHPNDIRAAKLNGIRSIAVATGVVPRAELVAHRPDVLLPDLRCLRVETVL
jgi:phosphoglycolate phosphatase